MYDFNKMKEAGYTEADISNAIGYDYSKMRGEGYTDDDISSAIEANVPSSESTPTTQEVKPTTSTPVAQDTTGDVMIDNATNEIKDFKNYLKYKVKLGEIDQAEYDTQLSKKMKEGVKVTGIESLGEAYNKTTPEDIVSKALASASVLRQDGSPTAYVTDALQNIVKGNVDDNSKKIALQYLAKNNVINSYNGNTNTVELQDGRTVPFDSSFASMIAANANTMLGSIFGGIGGAVTGTAESPVGGTIIGAKLGSAAGAGLGASSDFARASKFLGQDFDANDIARAVSVASSDDLLFSAIASKISNMGVIDKISEKATRIKNAFINNDIDGAWETYTRTTNLSDNELTGILEQGSKLRGIDVPDLNTTEGKKKAFEMVAMYDDTISGQVISAAKLNPDAISNAGRILYKNTENIKNLVKADDVKAIEEIANLNKQSSELYGEMRKTFSNAFDNVPVNFDGLKNKFGNTLDILEQNKSGFNEKVQAKINAFANKAGGLESVDDLIMLNKDYNALMRTIKKSGALSDAQYKAIGKGKNDIVNELVDKVSSNPILTSDEKQKLLSSFTNSNFAVQEVNKVIDTDLYSAVTTKRGNVKEQNKILDTIISKAKEGSVKGELDDSTKLLNALDDEQYQNLEKNIIDRVVSKAAIDKKGLISDFSKIAPELKSIEHMLRSDNSKQIMNTLEGYSNLMNNDAVLHFVSNLQPEVKLSTSGLSKDFTMGGPIEQASVARLFGRLQVIAPTIFRELGIEGITNRLPLLKQWEGASKEMSLKLNLVDALAEAKDVPSFFTNILVNQGDKLSEPAKRGIQGLLTDYAKVNVMLQNIPAEERVKLQKQLEDKQSKQVVPYAIKAEEIPSNIKSINAPKENIIDTEATRNYTKGTDDRYFDEFGNMYNNKSEIPSSDTPIPVGIENKAATKKVLDTSKESVVVNKDAYKEDIVQESYAKGFKSSKDVIDEKMKGKEVSTIVNKSTLPIDNEKHIVSDIEGYTIKKKNPTMIINGEEINKTDFDKITKLQSNQSNRIGITKEQKILKDKYSRIYDDIKDMDWKPNKVEENSYPTIEDFMTKQELNKARAYAKGSKTSDTKAAYNKWIDSTKKVNQQMDLLGF